MMTGIKAELEQSKLRLEFFKVRNQQQPNQVDAKWVEIYQDRIKKLERQLQKLELKSKPAAPSKRTH